MKSIKYLLVFAAISVSAISSVACGSAIGLATGAGEVITNEDELQSILIEIDQRHIEEVQNLHQEMNEARDVIAQMLDRLSGINPDSMMTDSTSTTGIVLQDESPMIIHPQFSEVMDIGQAYLSGLDQNESQQAFSEETNALKDRVMQILMEPKETELERIQRLEIEGLNAELALLDQHIQELYQEIDEMHFDSDMDEFEKDELKNLGDESEKMIKVMQQIIGADPKALSTALQADTKEAREARNQIILANDKVLDPNFKHAVEDFVYDKNIDKEDAIQLSKTITQSSGETVARVSASNPAENCLESGKSKIACEARAKNEYMAAGIRNEDAIKQIVIDAAAETTLDKLKECVSLAQKDPARVNSATADCRHDAKNTFKNLSPVDIEEPKLDRIIKSTTEAVVKADKEFESVWKNDVDKNEIKNAVMSCTDATDTSQACATAAKDFFVKDAAKDSMVREVTGGTDFSNIKKDANKNRVGDLIRECMKANGFDPDSRDKCTDEAYDEFSVIEPSFIDPPKDMERPSNNYDNKKVEAQQSVADIVQEMKDGKITEKQFNDKLDKATRR